MMSYARALAGRRKAAAQCELARRDVHAAVDDVIDTYQAHPLPALAGAVVVGFVLAQLRVGHGVVRAGMRVATGPAWRLVRQYIAF